MAWIDAIDEGEDRAVAIADQFDEGFITDEERHRLTVDNWTKIDTKVQEMLVRANGWTRFINGYCH